MLELRDVSARRGEFRLDTINLALPEGACGVLVGGPGCGKTSLLEAVAGLLGVSHGGVYVDGRDVTRFDVGARGLGYVPVGGGLFPVMSVFENVAFGLRLRGWGEDRVAERVAELGAQVGMVSQLAHEAGGLGREDALRVAVARALAFFPKLILFDDPLAGLDEEGHDRCAGLLQELQIAHGFTALVTTRRRSEAERFGTMRWRMEAGVVSVW